MDMIERIAKAIFDVETEAEVFVDGISNKDRLTLARAAIGEMREPTEAMRLAVENDKHIQMGLDDCNQHDIPDEAWRVMIDAALKKA